MIEIKNIKKTYMMGDNAVEALRGVSISIKEGEFVAIMGPSGSGKSTLMHILGLLDTPDDGSYHLYGSETSKLNEDELALRRRNIVGFVFQQFNLLPRMSAVENAALPLIYTKRHADLAKAEVLVRKMGIGDRTAHKPNELSGGQQQRVAIARALINDPRIIFADEPTGNLDTKSSQDIMDELKKLNGEGITVIIVTHEEEIGRQARRLIRMRDGQIQSDEILSPEGSHSKKETPVISNATPNLLQPSEIFHHFKQGFKTLAANKVRTGLSMLGILIGVAAVVAMLAVGSGAKIAIQKQLSSLGSNLLMIRSGAHHMGGVALETGAATRLTMEDAESIEQNIPNLNRVAPIVTGRGQVTFLDKNWNTQVIGAGMSYAQMHNAVPEIGRFFTDEENRMRSLVAVIGTTVLKNLFGNENPIGENIKINKVNFQIIGILPKKGSGGFRDQDDVIVIPLMTAMNRLLGKDYVDYIEVEAASPEATDTAQDLTKSLMLTRHRVPPSQQQDAFEIRNTADIKQAFEKSSNTMSTLLAAIATISLLVGGIGIMNIMLVSVTERTREIGLRKAVGARRTDILSQFLAEAIVVSSVGGFLGITLGWVITIFMSLIAGWTTSISLSSILMAFFFSAGIGIVFGLYPAQKASRLNPIDALRYE